MGESFFDSQNRLNTHFSIILNKKRNKMTKGFFGGYFEGFESIKWKAYGIVPLKIENTDPVSGVLVTSVEKRVAKDGTVWEKELVEQFYFNLEGKIDYVKQWTRDLNE